MHWSNSSVLLFMLYLIFGVKSNSTRKTYGEILESLHIEETFELLRPANLLINDEFMDNRMNTICARDLNLYKDAIRRGESWALKMLDASSKLPTGIMKGNIIDYGAFDECIETSETITTEIEIQGRHCMYDINPTFINPLPINLTLSICMPASCSADDVLYLMNEIVHTSSTLQSYGVTVPSASCTKVKSEVSTKAIFIILFIMAIYIGFLMFCTALDLSSRRNSKQLKSGLMQSLVRFSYLKNSESILSLEVQKGDFPVIHGIRAISSMLILLCHQIFLQMFIANVNSLDIEKWYTSWISLDFFSAIMMVDTFFILSSFLMTYSFFKRVKENEEINIFDFYLHRFIRLSLPIVITILFAIFFIQSIGSGPRWEYVENIFLTGCRSKWWSVILYISNFVEKENCCLLHLWSTSVDMQLFWISPFILYPLYRRPKIGLAILVSLFLVSTIITAYITGINKYSSMYFNFKNFDLSQSIEAFKDIYLMPYCRLSPWLFGIFVGYEVTYKSRKPSRLILYIGWTLSVAAIVFFLLAAQFLKNVNYEYNLIWEVIFAATIRPVWAFWNCWIIYASIHKSAGIISDFLSWKLFLPISRISYCIYLIHPGLIFYQLCTLRVSAHFNVYYVYHSFISNFILSIILAFLFSLTFERPMLVLNNIISKKSGQSLRETPKFK